MNPYLSTYTTAGNDATTPTQYPYQKVKGGLMGKT